MHCAGLKAVGEGEERPLAYWDVNVGGTIALAEIMGEAGVARFVFSSSATVYGQPDALPVDERAPLKPQGVYGRTKRAAEEFLRDLARANPNWRIGILRYFNPAGAHPSARIGEAPRGRPQNLVPLLCRIASGSVGELAVFGSDWPTPDGTGVRDYLHVQDLADGHVAALRFLATEPRRDDAQPRPRPRRERARGGARVRARLRTLDREGVRAAASRRRRLLLRRSVARERAARLARDARPRRDLRRRLALAAGGRRLLSARARRGGAARVPRAASPAPGVPCRAQRTRYGSPVMLLALATWSTKASAVEIIDRAIVELAGQVLARVGAGIGRAAAHERGTSDDATKREQSVDLALRLARRARPAAGARAAPERHGERRAIAERHGHRSKRSEARIGAWSDDATRSTQTSSTASPRTNR